MTTTTSPIRIPLTGQDLTAATHVRDSLGWHKVVHVSNRAITVETPWDWHELLPIRSVLEAR